MGLLWTDTESTLGSQIHDRDHDRFMTVTDQIHDRDHDRQIHDRDHDACPHDVRASQTQTQVIQFMVKSMVKTERLASLQPGCGWAAYQGLELRISARRKGCVSALRIMRIPYPWSNHY